jgi:hypothetical protein
MFSQAEINLMEKQLLFLLDYDLSVTEDDICHFASPFLDQYAFEEDLPSPVSEITSALPVTPRLASGSVVESIHKAAIAKVAVPTLTGVPALTKRYRTASPPFDRSSSASSIWSGSEGLRTPCSLSPSSSPEARHGEEVHSSYSRSEPIIVSADMPPYITSETKLRTTTDTRESLVRRIFGRRPVQNA